MADEYFEIIDDATGKVPGSPQHTGQHCVLGAAPNVVGQEQNILDFVFSSI